eukprot:scaffold2072_cov162-Amphora_coffeaeformis.AAC.11
MQAISTMNNEAVHVFLSRGSHETCINLLLKAMDGLRHAASVQHNMATKQAPNDACFSVVPMEEAGSSKLMAASPSNTFTLYPQAFTIQCNGGMDQRSSLELSVVLLFNIGLTYHLRAMRRPTACQSDFKEALRYYKLGLTLVCQNGSEGSDSSILYLISLALLNNAGHVFSHFGFSPQANVYRERMEDLLDNDTLFGIPEEHIEFFHSNVFFAKSCSIRAAPAA